MPPLPPLRPFVPRSRIGDDDDPLASATDSGSSRRWTPPPYLQMAARVNLHAKTEDVELLDDVPDRPRSEPLAGPAVVHRFDYREERLLTLLDAFLIGLENSRTVKLAQIAPRKAQTAMMLANSRFDLNIGGGAGWSIDDRALTSTVDTAGTGTNQQIKKNFGSSAGAGEALSFSKTFITGGQLRAGWQIDNQRVTNAGAFTALNPFWRSETVLQLSQPLFRERGVRYNRIPLVIAQTSLLESRHKLDRQLNDLMRDINAAYWILVLAYRVHSFKVKDLDQAKGLLDREITRLQVGESSLFEVNLARNYYEHLRLDVLNAEQRVLRGELELRRAMGIPFHDGMKIVVRDEVRVPEFEVNWEQDLQVAFQKRPDLRAQRAAVKKAKLSYDKAKNGLKPNVNFEAGYVFSGLNDDLGDAVDHMFDGSNANWSLNVRYQGQLGRRTVRSAVQLAYLNWLEASRNLEQLEYLARYEMQQSLQEVYLAVERYEHSKLVSNAGLHTFQAYQRYYQLGEVSLDQVLQARALWGEAKEEEERAIVKVFSTMGRWEHARGTLFEQFAFFADETSVENADPKDIAPDAADAVPELPELE